MTEQQMIQAIRAYAEALYSKGWDIVVEAYDDGDLLEELSQNDMNLTKTIQSLQVMIDVRADMMAEHQAEANSSY
jgi:H2-forming N5,N10-methylenetetrahydromethanopterin dehydrogenase-like enzyme